MPDLVTFGETCVVLVAKSGGPLRYSAEFERRPGGAESTVAAGVAKLGHSSGWGSRLGDDEFGRYILSVMNGEGVDTSCVRLDNTAPTGVFFRENRPLGGSAVFYYRKDSAFATFGPDDVDEDYIASARILHVTGITLGLSESCRAAVNHAVDIAKKAGVTVVFDPNYRAKVWEPDEALPHLETLMRKADYVLAGLEDMAKLTGLVETQAVLSYLHGMDLPEVILKTGAEGAIISNRNGIMQVPGHPLNNPVDRFGAGDSFAVGFIVGLLEKRSLRECVALGNAVAGWAIRLPGNIESLPSWSDLDNMLDGNKHVQR